MINKINNLSQSEFVKVFANIFENATWIAEDLYKQKPFHDFEELSSKMLNIFEKATDKKKLKLQYRSSNLKDSDVVTSANFQLSYGDIDLINEKIK